MDKKIKPNDPGINHRTVVGKAKSTPEDSKLDPSGNEHGQNDIFNSGGGQIGHETPGPEFDPGSSSQQQQQQRQTEVGQEQSDGQSSQHHHHRHHHRHETKIRGKVADRIQIPWILSMVGSKSFAAAWEAFIGICFFGYFFLVTYESVFSYESRFVWALLFTMDTLFLVDLLIRLVIEIWRSCTATPCIFFLMPLTLKWYIFQMISLFPLEIFCLYILDKDSISSLNNIDYFRINRFFNIFRLWRYYQILDEERMLPEMVVFLLKFFTVYLAFLQLVACVFYLLARTDPIDYMFSRNQETLIGTWLEYAKKVKPGFVPSPITHYILTLSFATNIVTTVGYGDIVPRNEAEMLVSIVIMLIGAIGMVGIFGSNVTSFSSKRTGHATTCFTGFSPFQSLSNDSAPPLFLQVREYYDCLWNFREGVFHVQFIHYLPTSMHEDILFDICTEMFLKAILFRGLEESFLRAVCRVVEVILYNPDMIICQQGGYAMTMYYIIQGECVVKSRHNSNINTAILRAGCVFGESSLFFSFPYSVNVETRTCCQLLRLNKEKMMEVFNDHIHILNLMRSRIQERMSELRLFYEEIGQPPITWVQFRQQIELLSLKPYADYPTDLRWSHGCNRLVMDDIVDDTEAAIIVDMPCLYKKYAKKNMTVYSTCVVPPTLISPHAWVHYWHIFMMILVMVISFLAPFSLAFTKTSEVAFYTSTTLEQGQLLVAVVCMIDVVIEVTTACPVTGIHYKFKDGIRVKMNQLGFYVDILAAIPFEFFQNIEKDSKWVKWAATFTEIFKLWKVHRYLRYLDDAYPQRLFWFRLIKTTLTLLYVIHFLACFMFILTCPFEDKITEHGIDNPRTCLRPSWLDSWFLDQLILDKKIDETVSANRLANKFPYLISVYFSTATITWASS